MNRFNEISAADYELWRTVIPQSTGIQEKVGECLRRWAADKKDSVLKVLEVGAGTGCTTKQILLADPRFQILAVDVENDMLQRLMADNDVLPEGTNFRQRVKTLELDITNSAQAFTETQVFEVVVSAFTIHNFEPSVREKVVADFYGLLKPGGIFVNADKIAYLNEFEEARYLINHIQSLEALDKVGRPDLRDRITRHLIEDYRIQFTSAEQKRILTEAGFKLLKTEYCFDHSLVVTATRPN